MASEPAQPSHERASQLPTGRASRASLLPGAPPPEELPRWKRALRSSGPFGWLALTSLIVFVDFTLAIRPWAAAPATFLETLFFVPFVRLVIAPDPHEERTATRWLRLRARVVHALNILFLAFAIFLKWRAMVLALWTGDHGAYLAAYRSAAVVGLALGAFGVLGRGARAQRFLSEAADHPARLMAVSFGLCCFVGGFLLSLPEAVRDVRDASFLDGLFHATSAVCVTGLAVSDIGATYTRFGQVVLLVLVQIGGLGIMSLSASFAVLAGRRLRVKQTAVLAEMIDASSISELRRSLFAIVGYTLIFEAMGAGLLWLLAGLYPEITLGPEDPHPIAGAGDRVWWAVFHSVSAFCNAGFSLSHGNLAGFAGSWGVCAVIMALIVLGGIGFPVIDELRRHAWSRLRRRRPPRPSLHLRVSLAYTGALIAGVALVVLVLEWGRSLSHLSWPSRVLSALFSSVTLRTAGCNTVDFGVMGPAMLVLCCAVMFIGACPGSCGGGVKTTTFATLLAHLRAELRGEPARLFDRQISEAVTRKATGVAFLSVLLVAVLFLALLLVEDHAPLRLLFEVVSAFATCGLSTGITGSLTGAGKVLIILAMFVGRIGPLTLALAMARTARRSPVSLPEERVMIG